MENGFLDTHRRDLQHAADELRARTDQLSRAESDLHAQPSGHRHPSADASDLFAATQVRDEAVKRFAELLLGSPLSNDEQRRLTGFAPAELAALRRRAG